MDNKDREGSDNDCKIHKGDTNIGRTVPLGQNGKTKWPVHKEIAFTGDMNKTLRQIEVNTSRYDCMYKDPAKEYKQNMKITDEASECIAYADHDTTYNNANKCRKEIKKINRTQEKK